MTAVPVVSATLTTRTVREAFDGFNWWERSPRAIEAIGSHRPQDIRERLSVDPVFVVVDAAPDLTCRTCEGTGARVHHRSDGTSFTDACSSCGGSGVSPVYAATWQFRIESAAVGSTGWWSPDYDDDLDDCVAEMVAEGRRGFERRQVVEWRATDVTVLPVVGPPGRLRIEFWPHRDKHRVMLTERGQVYRTNPDGGPPLDVTDEPWAVDLRPGMCVLCLDGWEHLEQPHTEMACLCPGYRKGALTGTPGEFVRRPDWCSACSDETPGRVPLSVPDGVLSWIDLA